MRHPSDGTLRRLLDEPAGVPDIDRDHVAACDICQSGLAAAGRDADLAAAALACDVDPDIETAWRALSASVTATPAQPVRPAFRTTVSRPLIATAAAVALLAGATAAAATDWFPVFRADKVAPITVNPAELVQLPDLSAYGTLVIDRAPHVRQVTDAAAAEQVTGLPTPVVASLPHGVTGTPAYFAGDQAAAVFTFSAAKARQTAEAAGEPLPAPPAGLDGAKFRLTAGPGVAEVWRESRGAPAMVVGRATAPRAFSSGIPFATARDYLLTLPGIPQAVADQLRRFSADGATLPLIVRSADQTSTTADVNGVSALVLSSRDGAFTGVFWVRDGMVNAVAGSLSADEVLDVARNLRWGR
ncbi:hypothetical protein BJY16_007663 [Actinoplanes octamycinicus]|uniref:Anti-sigma factor RsiW n=1 Tax=Actinoplanes octamycinicus TaxID=135948 RepID=A0A7W7H5A9_9ACTN|nr:hypothetical protein [Actinoplanes octamycinicus]MBB4744204.1 hypothetical protein [Actinoplanes octamycinicus]GIE56837.1 hypothetical protein Aoc01nite_22390 [Actinoplanes octamycinicus]